MNLKEIIYKLFKSSDYAKRNAESADGGQCPVRGGIHRFESARGKAISDCCRVRLLAEALSSQRGRTPDSGTGDKIRRLTDAAKKAGLWLDKTQIAAFGDLVSKRTGESEVYWNRPQPSPIPVCENSAKNFSPVHNPQRTHPRVRKFCKEFFPRPRFQAHPSPCAKLLRKLCAYRCEPRKISLLHWLTL